MFKNATLPFNASLLECTSILAFAAVGYSLMYKFAFFSGLGAQWYVNSISPFNLFVTSLTFIFNLIVGSVSGFGLGYILSVQHESCRSNFLKAIMILLPMFLPPLIIVYSGFKGVSFLSKFIGENQVIVIWISVFLAYMIVVFVKLRFADHKNRITRSLLVVNLITLVFLTPLVSGSFESKVILKNDFKTLSKVKLVGSSEDWYLIEFLNDKALLGNKNNEINIKVVEYKSIERIISNKNRI